MSEARGRWMAPRAATTDPHSFGRRYDVALILVVVAVLAFGLVVVASASTSISARAFGDPLAYFWRQSIHVALAAGALALGARTPMRFWERTGPLLMVASLLMLALVLIPGVGREVNGATRWLTIGGVNLQPSEPAKLFLVLYLAGYLARVSRRVAAADGTASRVPDGHASRDERRGVTGRPGLGLSRGLSRGSSRGDRASPGVGRSLLRLRALLPGLGGKRRPVRGSEDVPGAYAGIVVPIAVLVTAGGLLKLEPDHGAIFVLCITVLGMLFLAGVSIAKFAVWAGVGLVLASVAALTSPHVILRLTSFLDPFADPFGSGFQLVQALIAIGRGGWLGVGLGEGVQKLFYLPEAHTDFLFAVLAEEFGFVGMLVTVALFTFLVLRSLSIGRDAGVSRSWFSMHVAYGIGLLIGLHAFINIGVNIGLLPTKGLTLPLMSYGGSSLVVCGACIGILLRIDHETRTRSEGGAP